MNRLAAMTAGAALLFATGCKGDGEWSVSKALGWDAPPGRVGAPPKDVPPASLAVAERVEVLGRKLVAQNTFTGIEPMFMTIGVKEAVLFHRGSEQLFISEGLVEQCKSDAELAAVLCSEMGQMVAEKRASKAVGRDVEPIPDATHGAGREPGGAAYDAGQQANLAYYEKQFPRGAARPDPVDAQRTARDLLVGAGYSPAELDRVEPLLKQSERGEKLKKQMGGSAPPPDWKR
ncbi:MAG: hypothetical protein J0I06_26160 [Planctomycetes bacterium]|nr:hypothetical protein [Planctomycetota bacterium]